MIELEAAAVAVPAAAASGATKVILESTTLSLTEHRISIIGGNGSGKSTLARLLNGLIEPSSGSVRVQDDTASQLASEPSAGRWLDTHRDGAAVRRQVGFVFTDPSAQLIMPTAAEDVALSLRRSHSDTKARHRAAIATLERFGLGALADQSVHSLSGGQKQLLALASVLATDPAILVADEPTTLLDLRNSRMIGDLLLSLPQQLVVVTHDLELAARADRTLVVDGGAVVFDGTPSQAIAYYHELVGVGPNPSTHTDCLGDDAPRSGAVRDEPTDSGNGP